MSGTSLITSFLADMDDTVSSIINSGDSVHSIRSSNSSPGPGGLKGGMSRPPGLGGLSMPSPIGKPGHSYTSSTSTAQNLTLTPTSSLDGGELSYAKQSSPFHVDGPSMTSDPPGFGSFDGEEGDHDGLLGLQALPRDRAQSHPGSMGPYTSPSPTGIRDDGRPMRPRTVSRESGRAQSAASRPPLSGSANMSPQVSESKTYYSGNRSRDHSPTPQPGIISRPGIPFEPSFHDHRIGGGRDLPTGVDQLTNQFSQLGNQQGFLQGQQQNYQRHQRASSMPGPMPSMQQDSYQDDMSHHTAARRGSEHGVGMYMGGEYMDPRYSNQGLAYGQDPMARPQIISQRRSSLHNTPQTNADMYGHTMHMHRRESLDFVPGHNRYPDGVPVVASNQEMRMYMNDDPYRNDRGMGYGGHHRNPSSDMGSSTLSSSPASMNSSGMVRLGKF